MEMNDIIGLMFSAAHLREWTIDTNVVAAFFIGSYLAFAATPDAGWRCFQAFVRLIHRVVLVGFAIALMNNAMVLASSDRVPTGSAFAVSVFIFISVIISALRYKFWMGDIPTDASWRNPHFPKHRTEKQAVIEAIARRKTG